MRSPQGGQRVNVAYKVSRVGPESGAVAGDRREAGDGALRRMELSAVNSGESLRVFPRHLQGSRLRRRSHQASTPLARTREGIEVESCTGKHEQDSGTLPKKLWIPGDGRCPCLLDALRHGLLLDLD